MNRREERILHRAEKAGRKFEKKTGHAPSREELLHMKIQVVPDYLRWLMFLGSVACGLISWRFLENDIMLKGSIFAVISFLLLVFSIFGIRRTLEAVVDHMGYHLLDALGSIFD